MKYYIIAGEHSGDLHASNLMKELKMRDASAEFRCWGGDLMQAEGAVLVKHIRDISFMGFSEVLMNIRTIMANFKLCRADILEYKPDVIILVDYPGFNLRMAEFSHKQGIPVFFYISPQVWAWKKGRVKKIKAFVDRMFVILPFEQDFYRSYDYHVDFAGHPLLDAIEQYRSKGNSESFIKKNGLDERPVIAILPGSRHQEISRMLNVMLQVVPAFPAYQFVVAGTSNFDSDFYTKMLGNSGVKIVYGQTYDLLSNARAALVTSGTATLETALFGVPEVVCYRGSGISFQIAKRLVDIKYISLVNLIMDKPVVTELIQSDLNLENLKKELKLILDDATTIERIKTDYNALREKLGGSGASAKTAELMIHYLKK
jgi:lipid-A-disaccharide synthase